MSDLALGDVVAFTWPAAYAPAPLQLEGTVTATSGGMVMVDSPSGGLIVHGDGRTSDAPMRVIVKAEDCTLVRAAPRPLMPGGESTSAALRRVEAERDELRDIVEMLPCGDCWGMGLIPADWFGRDVDGAPWTDEEKPCPEGCEIPGWLQAERNDAADDARLLRAAERERDQARAELASARTELDAVRTARDNLDRELGEVRNRIAELERAYTSADAYIAQLKSPTATSEPSLTWTVPPAQTEGAPPE